MINSQPMSQVYPPQESQMPVGGQAMPSAPQLVQTADGQPFYGFGDGTLVGDLVQAPAPSLAHLPFHVNLATILSPAEVSAIGRELKRQVDDDIQSQQPYFQACREGIRALSLEPGNKKGASPYDGISTYESKASFDALLHTTARVRQYLYKADNMVRTTIIGVGSPDKQKQADRIKTMMNYYLTYIDKGFRKEGLKAHLWAMQDGWAYLKVYIDPVLGRPTSRLLNVEDFIVHRGCSSHHISMRKTQRLILTEDDIRFRIESGMYRPMNFTPISPGFGENEDVVEEVNRTIGYEEVPREGSYLYHVMESYVHLNIEGDWLTKGAMLPSPYIVTYDHESGAVASIYRNWRERDMGRQEVPYFACISGFPSFKGEGYGLNNYATRLLESANMLGRQMINAAVVSNFPGGIVRQARLDQSLIAPRMNEFVNVMSPSEDLNKDIVWMPYRQPSPLLTELKTDLENQIMKPVAVMTEEVQQLASHAPQSTTLFMLEQMHQVPNALMQGFYESFAEILELMRMRMEEWMTPGTPYPFAVEGQQSYVMKDDFNGEVKIFPVGDPSLSSSSYRILQSELVLQTSEKYPQLHNPRAVVKNYYENIGMDPTTIAEIMVPEPPQPPPVIPLGPVEENSNLLNGVPVKAGMDQDHQAHEIVHSQLYAHPDPNVAAAAQAHGKEHQAMAMMIEMYTSAGIPIPQDPTQVPPQMQNQIAQRIAAALQAKQQASAPPPEPSPAHLKMAEIETQKEKMHLEAQNKMAEIRLEQEKMNAQQQIEAATLAEKEAESRARLQLEQIKFEHEKALKKMEIEMKSKEIALKEQDDRRKQEAHARDLQMRSTSLLMPHSTLTKKD